MTRVYKTADQPTAWAREDAQRRCGPLRALAKHDVQVQLRADHRAGLPNGDAGVSPVVNLQTNFGGGKTHSMLVLYHLFSGTPAKDFPQGLQELVAANGNPDPSTLGVRRVALAGTYLKAGSPITAPRSTRCGVNWPGSWAGGRPMT